MINFEEGDAVVLVDDIPDHGLKKGQIGAILLKFEEPTIAYETEFTDSDGRTIAQLPLRPEQIRRY